MQMSSSVPDSDLSYDAVPPGQVQMIDLFAGPGGLDVAACWLGIPSVGIEWDDDACRTRVAARLGTRHSDVRDISLLREFPSADILTGGPPCQTYSVAGSGAGRKALDRVLHFVRRMDAGEDVSGDVNSLDDHRTGLILEPLRWVLAAKDARRPFRTIVLEQVPTVRPVWAAYEKALRRRGYDVDIDVLRTEQFGVPQTRRRAILVARLDGGAKLPTVSHRKYHKQVRRAEGDQTLLPWNTMGEALPGRPSPFEVVSNYGTGGKADQRGRRRSDEPSATVTGKVRRNRVYAGDEELDRFTAAEAGRLQTFPVDYPWRGRDQYQQVGNAIPPRLGACVLAAAAFGRQPRQADLDRMVGSSWSALEPKESALALEEFWVRPSEGVQPLWGDLDETVEEGFVAANRG